jgi:hypothetical protein
VLDFLAKDWFRPVRSSADFPTYFLVPFFLTNSGPHQDPTVVLFLCYTTGPFCQPPSSSSSPYHMEKKENPTHWKFSQKCGSNKMVLYF